PEPMATADEIGDIFGGGAHDAVRPEPAPGDVEAVAQARGRDDGPGEEGSDAEPRADVSGVVEDRQGEEAEEAGRSEDEADAEDQVEFDAALREDARTRFEEFLDAERDFEKHGGWTGAPRDVVDRYSDASDALVETFR